MNLAENLANVKKMNSNMGDAVIKEGKVFFPELKFKLIPYDHSFFKEKYNLENVTLSFSSQNTPASRSEASRRGMNVCDLYGVIF